jgi:hypothetical protein
LLGCSSQDQATEGGADASVDAVSDAGSDVSVDAPTSDAGSACNALTNIGAVVPQMFVATDAVTGDGGTIAAGTYVLTAAAVYTGGDGGAGPTGTTFQDTLAMGGDGTYERVASIADDAGLDGSPFHQNGSFVVDGGSIQVTQTCPTGAQPFTSYDSDGAKLHIYAPALAGNPGVMFEYTKQ